MLSNLIIRRSKIIKDLILTSNIEKVYRVYLSNEEKYNNIDYNKVSDYFNKLEKEINFI